MALALAACGPTSQTPLPDASTEAGSDLDGAATGADAAGLDRVHGADLGPADANRLDTRPASDAAGRDNAVGVDRAGGLDAGPADRGTADARPPATGPDPDPSWTPPTPGRGWQWVRANPMFISGLVVGMGQPPAAAVNTYYDTWKASATHLWQDGLADPVLGWAAAGRADFRWVSWTRNDGSCLPSNQVLGGLSAPPAGRIGYQVGDEPGLERPDWEDMNAIAQGIANLRAVDPESLIIVNFTFNADDVDALIDHFCTALDGDVISYDKYSDDDSEYLELERYWAKGRQHNVPYWRYLRSYHDSDQDPWLTESDLRWQAFSGIVYGFTGHTWFIYQIPASHELDSDLFEQAGGWSAQPTARFGQVAQINAELRRLGQVVTQLRSTDVRYIAYNRLAQPEGTRGWEPGAGDDPFLSEIALPGGLSFAELSVGFFMDDDGSHYVVLHNPEHSSASFPRGGDDAVELTLGFDFSAAGGGFDPSQLLAFDKVSGRVEAVPLGGDGAERRLELSLEAGEIFFFKYDNGRPFAMQP